MKKTGLKKKNDKPVDGCFRFAPDLPQGFSIGNVPGWILLKHNKFFGVIRNAGPDTSTSLMAAGNAVNSLLKKVRDGFNAEALEYLYFIARTATDALNAFRYWQAPMANDSDNIKKKSMVKELSRKYEVWPVNVHEGETPCLDGLELGGNKKMLYARFSRLTENRERVARKYAVAAIQTILVNYAAHDDLLKMKAQRPAWFNRIKSLPPFTKASLKSRKNLKAWQTVIREIIKTDCPKDFFKKDPAWRNADTVKNMGRSKTPKEYNIREKIMKMITRKETLLAISTG